MSRIDETEPQERMRLLKPSLELYFSISLVIFCGWVLLAFFLGIKIVLLVLMFGLACSPGLVKPIADMLASWATQKQLGDSLWYEIDVKAEQEMHSTLRAKRIFGHSIKG